jgi:cytoskeletal protein RodZ
MNKNVIIIGALSLIGVGAFLYFKPKKTNQNIIPSTAGDLVAPSVNSVLPTPTSTLSVPPTQSNVTIGEVTLTTPVQVVETALKISEAKDIANRILDARNKRKNSNHKGAIDKIIKELDKNLALLGYVEVNGSIQKI